MSDLLPPITDEPTAPAEALDAPREDGPRVIQFAPDAAGPRTRAVGAEFERRYPWLARDKDAAKGCPHVGVLDKDGEPVHALIDAKQRTLRCSACGTFLDPFWLLLKKLEYDESVDRRVEFIREANRREAERADLKARFRRRVVERSEVDHGGRVGRRQHLKLDCGHLIWRAMGQRVKRPICHECAREERRKPSV